MALTGIDDIDSLSTTLDAITFTPGRRRRTFPSIAAKTPRPEDISPQTLEFVVVK
jgi:hypothetical protein